MADNKAERLCQLARQFGISEVYVFGSRSLEIAALLRETPYRSAFSGSDVDIAVQPEEGRRLSAREKVLLLIAFEDLLEVPRVDLVVIPEADPFLATEVIRGELLYCSDLDRQAENELYILRRAGDLAHYKRERIKALLS
jgi:uncharacterized protein